MQTTPPARHRSRSIQPGNPRGKAASCIQLSRSNCRTYRHRALHETQSSVCASTGHLHNFLSSWTSLSTQTRHSAQGMDQDCRIRAAMLGVSSNQHHRSEPVPAHCASWCAHHRYRRTSCSRPIPTKQNACSPRDMRGCCIHVVPGVLGMPRHRNQPHAPHCACASAYRYRKTWCTCSSLPRSTSKRCNPQGIAGHCTTVSLGPQGRRHHHYQLAS